MTSRYTYRILGTPPEIQIEVRLGFSGDLSTGAEAPRRDQDDVEPVRSRPDR